MRRNQFLHAELDALAVVSRNTFRMDDPDLAAQRWQATDREQDADAAWLQQRGILIPDSQAFDAREELWMLSPEGLERARYMADKSQHTEMPVTSYDVADDAEVSDHPNS